MRYGSQYRVHNYLTYYNIRISIKHYTSKSQTKISILTKSKVKIFTISSFRLCLMQMPTQNPLMLLLMFKLVLGKVFRKVIVTFDSFATVCYIVDQYVKFHWNIMIVSNNDSQDWEDCFIELLISWLSLTTWLPVFVPPHPCPPATKWATESLLLRGHVLSQGSHRPLPFSLFPFALRKLRATEQKKVYNYQLFQHN